MKNSIFLSFVIFVGLFFLNSCTDDELQPTFDEPEQVSQVTSEELPFDFDADFVITKTQIDSLLMGTFGTIEFSDDEKINHVSNFALKQFLKKNEEKLKRSRRTCERLVLLRSQISVFGDGAFLGLALDWSWGEASDNLTSSVGVYTDHSNYLGYDNYTLNYLAFATQREFPNGVYTTLSYSPFYHETLHGLSIGGILIGNRFSDQIVLNCELDGHDLVAVTNLSYSGNPNYDCFDFRTWGSTSFSRGAWCDPLD